MKLDDGITKKFLKDLLKDSFSESEKRTERKMLEMIKGEINVLRREFKAEIADAEKRIKGSLKFDISEITERLDKLEIREDKHYNFLIDKLDWLVGAYKKFEDEHDIHSAKISEHTDKLENYLQRLKTLEVRVALPV